MEDDEPMMKLMSDYLVELQDVIEGPKNEENPLFDTFPILLLLLPGVTAVFVFVVSYLRRE